MVKVFVGTKNEFYIDGYLQSNFDVAKKAIRSDWDMIFTIDGYEGTGKSVFAQQVAFYCDPTLILDRIVFNEEDFKKAVTNAGKYQAIIYDEAYGGLSSRAAMSNVNRSIIKMLTVIRAKNLFIFIVLPTFFDLDKYIALWRSRGLINVYSPGDFERGYFSFYGREEKRKLYVTGKQEYNYGFGKPNFRGRFTNRYLVDEEAYRKKKSETSMGREDSNRLGKADLAKRMKKQLATNLKTQDIGLSNTQIAKIIGVSRMTIHTYLHEDKEDEEISEEVIEKELDELSGGEGSGL